MEGAPNRRFESNTEGSFIRYLDHTTFCTQARFLRVAACANPRFSTVFSLNCIRARLVADGDLSPLLRSAHEVGAAEVDRPVVAAARRSVVSVRPRPAMVFPSFPLHSRRRRGAAPVFHVARATTLAAATPAVAQADKDAARAASREKQFASLLAGGVAGTLSATITCPMEVIKTRTWARAAWPAPRRR